MLKLFDSNIYSLVSNEAYGAIFRKITIIKIQESVPILSPGEHQQYLYFIKKGVVRLITKHWKMNGLIGLPRKKIRFFLLKAF